MGNYRVYVYAICKNERAFAARWMQSMREADGVYVLDTGSTDGTPEALTELGAQVTCEEITPWRFDTARNRSLELVRAGGIRLGGGRAAAALSLCVVIQCGRQRRHLLLCR